MGSFDQTIKFFWRPLPLKFITDWRQGASRKHFKGGRLKMAVVKWYLNGDSSGGDEVKMFNVIRKVGRDILRK